MLGGLTEKFENIFRGLQGRGKLSDKDIENALGEIKNALIDGDVNLNVVKKFIEETKSKLKDINLNKSLSPEQSIIKYVHESLIEMLGDHAPINLRHSPPVVIMMVGLQGAGKTTTCGKLAKYFKEELKRRPLLVPADVYRPAAIEQLKILGSQLNIQVFDSSSDMDPVDIAKNAEEYARKANFDTLILDTAGRLQIDEEMMNELIEIVESIEPHEILLVADAMTGQEAANVAQGFDARLDIDGIILTKMDGDTRGGAALSMRSITGKPIKMIGMGEKSDALEPFYPDRMASRILGMGDVLTLIEKAQKSIDLDKAKEYEKKMKKDQFTLADFKEQLSAIQGMGSFSSMMGMIPGMNQLSQKIDDQAANKQIKRVEAIINSMTPQERDNTDILNGSRRLRIAKGSGTSVEEVNRLMTQFNEMRKVMKKFAQMGPKALMRSLGGIGGMGGSGLKFK